MVNCTLEKILNTAKPKENKKQSLVHYQEKTPLLSFWFMGFLLSSLSL